MNKAMLILALMGIVILSHAYNWTPYGPQGIKITNICYAYNGHGILCSEDGLYLYQDDMEWHFYESTLPVIEVVSFSSEKLLAILGAGSYSDGIYSFDLESGEFEVLEWLYKPSFLRHYEHLGIYYAGQSEGGLHVSNDGTSWYTISLFDTIPCYDVAFYEEHIAISSGQWPAQHLLLSDNSGTSWFLSDNPEYFTEIECNGAGTFYAIFPGMSNSAGLRQSEDYGKSWVPVNWEFFISSLACDPFGNVLLGWDNGFGVARVDPDTWNPPFVYLNGGLPDTHVHAVNVNPAMSAPNVFVCTDSGAYYSYDYLTGLESFYSESLWYLYPNPALAQQLIHINVPGSNNATRLEIYDSRGVFRWRSVFDKPGHYQVQYALTKGVYFCVLKTANSVSAKKLIIY